RTSTIGGGHLFARLLLSTFVRIEAADVRQAVAAVIVPVAGELPIQRSHLDSSHGSIKALVARLGAGALNGLLDVVGGEHAKRHRNTGMRSHVTNAARCLTGDIIKMSGG